MSVGRKAMEWEMMNIQWATTDVVGSSGTMPSALLLEVKHFLIAGNQV